MTRQTSFQTSSEDKSTPEGTALRFFVLIVFAGCSFFLFIGFARNIPEFSVVMSVLLTISSLCFYFFPTLEALVRKHHDRLSIFLVNFFLGWTLLGWVFAFAWACKSQRPISVYLEKVSDAKKTESTPSHKSAAFASVADEISKLSDLKDRGLITHDEFEAQKAKVLAR